MNDYASWMNRCLGTWISYRRYLFGPKLKSGEYTTDFNITSTGLNQYKISWVGKTEGEMDLVLQGNTLQRSRGYFTDLETYQTMSFIDEDTIVFHTSYDGETYREEIRFLDDNTRLRQTVGRDDITGEYTLFGQYVEKRT